MTSYLLPGGIDYLHRIYPNPADLLPSAKLTTYAEVITHFTRLSLDQDHIGYDSDSVCVKAIAEGYLVSITPKPGHEGEVLAFAEAHSRLVSRPYGGLALEGAEACKATPSWNPMAGYPVNSSDGPCEWLPCLPLGLPMVNHRAVTLLHYPPIVALRNADYFNNNTLRRWAQVLECVGIPAGESTLYHSILDVNPIAAPGSGQSEYPNDYFPIGLTSLYYDDETRGLTYVRSMLELMLNPPSNKGNPYTLPLLVCGSPLYDPQAAGWFRVRYKDQLPRDEHGSPTVNVGQAGLVRLNPSSEKLTPYMIANHMIAAGVTGRCTDDPTEIPNISKYEAQDLVAATFLKLCHDQPEIHPEEAARLACRRWFGADDGEGAARPPSSDDQLILCALAQMDRCFDLKTLRPMYTYEEATKRCQQSGGAGFSPCFGCKPIPG